MHTTHLACRLKGSLAIAITFQLFFPNLFSAKLFAQHKGNIFMGHHTRCITQVEDLNVHTLTKH